MSGIKRDQVKPGSLFMAKVSGIVVPVQIVHESLFGGWEAINTATKRKIRIRGIQRLRPFAIAPTEEKQ